MTTLGSVDIGQVKSEKSTKDAQLFQQPMPGSDSTDAILLDIFGVLRTITIEGVYTSADATRTGVSIPNFIKNLDAIVNGNQSPISYQSVKASTETAWNVLVNSVEWHGDEADVNEVAYTLTLFEGSL